MSSVAPSPSSQSPKTIHTSPQGVKANETNSPRATTRDSGSPSTLDLGTVNQTVSLPPNIGEPLRRIIDSVKQDVYQQSSTFSPGRASKSHTYSRNVLRRSLSQIWDQTARSAESLREEEIEHVDASIVRHALSLLEPALMDEGKAYGTTELRNTILLAVAILKPKGAKLIYNSTKKKSHEELNRRAVLTAPPSNSENGKIARARSLPDTRTLTEEDRDPRKGLLSPKDRKLPENEPNSTVGDNSTAILISLLSYLRTTLHHVTVTRNLEQRRRRQAEASKTTIQRELNDLSEVLFDQANQMVSKANQEKALVEERCTILEGIVEELRRKLPVTSDEVPDGRAKPLNGMSIQVTGLMKPGSSDRTDMSATSGTGSAISPTSPSSLLSPHTSRIFLEFQKMLRALTKGHDHLTNLKSSLFHRILEEDVYPCLHFEGFSTPMIRVLFLSLIDGALELENVQGYRAQHFRYHRTSGDKDDPKSAQSDGARRGLVGRVLAGIRNRSGNSSANSSYADALEDPSASSLSPSPRRRRRWTALSSTRSPSTSPQSPHKSLRCILCGVPTVETGDRIRARIRSHQTQSAAPGIGTLKPRGFSSHVGLADLQFVIPGRHLSLETELERQSIAPPTLIRAPQPTLSSPSTSATSRLLPHLRAAAPAATIKSIAAALSSQTCKLLSQPDDWFPLDMKCFNRLYACMRFISWIQGVRLRFWAPHGVEAQFGGRDKEMALFVECQGLRMAMASTRVLGMMWSPTPSLGPGKSQDRSLGVDFAESAAGPEVVQRRPGSASLQTDAHDESLSDGSAPASSSELSSSMSETSRESIQVSRGQAVTPDDSASDEDLEDSNTDRSQPSTPYSVAREGSSSHGKQPIS